MNKVLTAVQAHDEGFISSKEHWFDMKAKYLIKNYKSKRNYFVFKMRVEL